MDTHSSGAARRRAGLIAAVATMLALAATPGPVGAGTYVLYDLGVPPGFDSTFGTHINNSRDVTAQGYVPGGGFFSLGLFWAHDSALPMTSVGTLGGSPTFSLILGLNDAGQVVGVSTIDSAGDHDGFLWSGGTIMPLGLGASNGAASDIDSAGRIVGHGDSSHALLLLPPYGKGSAVDKHVAVDAAADWTEFDAVNNKRHMAGTFAVAGQFTGFIFDDTTAARTDIHNTLGGTGLSIYVSDINDAGQVVGKQLGPGPSFVGHGLLFDGATHDIAPLSGDSLSYLSGINNTERAVGASCGGGSCRGIVVSTVSPFTATDMNAQLAPGSPQVNVADGINDAGYIAATASILGVSHAVLLSPCGNGVKDPGEECDLGPANEDASSCCSRFCKLKGSLDPPCYTGSGDPRCDPPIHCDGTSLTCPGPSNTDGVSCDNPNVCDGHETCLGRKCIAGTPLSCGDTDACTIDACNSDFGGCVHNSVATPSGSYDTTVTFMTQIFQCFVSITATSTTTGALTGTCDLGNRFSATGTIMPDGSFTLNSPDACIGSPGTITGVIDARFSAITNGDVDCSSTALGHIPYAGCRDVNMNKVCDSTETGNPFCPSGPRNGCTLSGCTLPGCAQGGLPNGTVCTDGNACDDLTACAAGGCPAGTPIPGCTPTTSGVGIMGPAGVTVATGDGVTVSLQPGALPLGNPVLVAGTSALSPSVQLGAGTRVVKSVKVEDGGVPLAAGAKATISVGWTDQNDTDPNSKVVTTATPTPKENQLQIWHNNAPVVTDATNCKSTNNALWPQCAQCFSAPAATNTSPYLAENRVCTNDASKVCVADPDCPGSTCSAVQVCKNACAGLECCCDRVQNAWTFETTSFSDFVMASACISASQVKLTVHRLGKPGKGSLDLAGRARMSAAVGPLANGVQLRFNDGAGPALDVTIPGGASTSASGTGWREPVAGRWVYLDGSPNPPGGIFRVVINQPTTTPGLIKFRVKGRKGSYAMTTATAPEITLMPSSDCVVATFPGPSPAPVCARSGATLRCR